MGLYHRGGTSTHYKRKYIILSFTHTYLCKQVKNIEGVATAGGLLCRTNQTYQLLFCACPSQVPSWMAKIVFCASCNSSSRCQLPAALRPSSSTIGVLHTSPALCNDVAILCAWYPDRTEQHADYLVITSQCRPAHQDAIISHFAKGHSAAKVQSWQPTQLDNWMSICKVTTAACLLHIAAFTTQQ